MASVDPNGKYQSEFYSTVDNAQHTAYTVPASVVAVLVTQISAADSTGAARTITVVANVAGTDRTLVKAGVIPANDALDLELKPLVMRPGDTIKVTGSASGIDVMMNFAEQSRNG